MATKNKIIVLIGILFAIVIAVFIVRACVEKSTTAIDNKELGSVLNNNPSSVILYGFDETKHEISDEKDVETIIDTLKNDSYKEKDQQDYVEGLYLMDIQYGNETVSLGMGGDCVSYEGVQYEVENGSLDEIINILTRYLDE